MAQDQAGATRKVLFYVPGLAIGPDKSGPLLERLRTEYGTEWEIHVFRHGVRPWTLYPRLDGAVERLAVAIGSAAGDFTGEAQTVGEVRLMGHSLGGLLIQSAYLRGLGIGGDPGSSTPGGWASKVRRVVLVGTPNQGFAPGRMPLSARLTYAFASPFWDFAAEAFRVGGYWITNLRLLWMETLRGMATPPLVVQVLGIDDDFIRTEDTQDSASMPNTGWTHMDGANHPGLVDLGDPFTAEYRWKVLREALFGSSIVPLPASSVSERPVHFIVHGIRASAYDAWVQQLKTELLKDPGGVKPAVVAMNYGFLSAYEFALPFSRNRKTHTFLTAYADASRSFNPDNFTFAGHSNGTFMMGRAMKLVPAVRFRHIFLAGSVLPQDYKWSALFGRQQVGRRDSAGQWLRGQVHNDRAAVDVPVGILATFLHGLRPFNSDIGPGGYRGFSEDSLPAEVSDHELAFPPGHGSALMDHPGQPPRMPQIVNYLLTGTPVCTPDTVRPAKFALMNRLVERLAWFLVFVVVALLVLAAWWLAGILGLWWAVGIYAAVLGGAYVALRSI